MLQTKRKAAADGATQETVYTQDTRLQADYVLVGP